MAQWGGEDPRLSPSSKAFGWRVGRVKKNTLPEPRRSAQAPPECRRPQPGLWTAHSRNARSPASGGRSARPGTRGYLVDFANDVEILPHQEWGKAKREFIDQEQLWRAHQTTADRDHRLLAAGQGAGELRAPLLQTRKDAEDFRHARTRNPFGILLICAKAQVFLHCELRKDLASLRDAGDASATTLWVGNRVMSVPSRIMRPPRGGVSPRMDLIKVVLPEPLEPSKHVIRPGSIFRETPSSTLVLS